MSVREQKRKTRKKREIPREREGAESRADGDVEGETEETETERGRDAGVRERELQHLRETARQRLCLSEIKREIHVKKIQNQEGERGSREQSRWRY
jgi:hypothetical protein